MRRAYYQGSSAKYYEGVLLPIGRSKSWSLVVYRDESESPAGAKVCIDDALRNDAFVELDYPLCPTLACPGSIVGRGLSMHVKILCDFGLGSDQRSNWLMYLLRRTRSLNPGGCAS